MRVYVSVFTTPPVVSKAQSSSTMGTSSTSASLKRVMSLGRLSRRWNKSRSTTAAAAAAAADSCETEVNDTPRSDTTTTTHTHTTV